jgi:hypothetical protein
MIWINCYLCGEKFQIRQIDYYRNLICNECVKWIAKRQSDFISFMDTADHTTQIIAQIAKVQESSVSLSQLVNHRE